MRTIEIEILDNGCVVRSKDRTTICPTIADTLFRVIQDYKLSSEDEVKLMECLVKKIKDIREKNRSDLSGQVGDHFTPT